MEKTSAKIILFEKAIELFRRDGYDNVTIQQICRESNVTRNAFYYYFDSKEELFGSYFDNMTSFTYEMIAKLQTLPNDWEKLWYIFEAHIKVAESEGLSFCRASIKVNLDGHGDLLDKYYVSETVTAPLIKSCQDQGLIRNMTEATELVYLATRMIAGVILTWCCKNGVFDLVSASKDAFCSLMQPVI